MRHLAPLLSLLLSFTAVAHAKAPPKNDEAAPPPRGSLDTLRLPFFEGKVYEVKVLPGEPFALELPQGQTVRNLWFNDRYFSAQTVPGGSRVFITASASGDALGHIGFLHVETDPSSLRVSLRLETVSDSRREPAALQLFLEGSALHDAHQREAARLTASEVVYAQRFAQDRAAKEFTTWRKALMSNMRGDEAYDRGGDFRIGRVTDDQVQTFISIPNATDRAVIQFVDKAGHAEIVNYELENGLYTIQNKVLRPGEKFRLILGKEQGWISLK